MSCTFLASIVKVVSVLYSLPARLAAQDDSVSRHSQSLSRLAFAMARSTSHPDNMCLSSLMALRVAVCLVSRKKFQPFADFYGVRDVLAAVENIHESHVFGVP